MSRESHSRKNDEAVREAVALIINQEISDPRVAFTTVTSARTSPDRTVATVYVSAEPERYEEVLAGLESAKGRIRSLLGDALGWRATPEVRFFIDEAIDEGSRIEAVLLANAAPVDPDTQDDE